MLQAECSFIFILQQILLHAMFSFSVTRADPPGKTENHVGSWKGFKIRKKYSIYYHGHGAVGCCADRRSSVADGHIIADLQ